MPMIRGTALVSTVAQVTQLTGMQRLATLEIGGTITLSDLLVTASDTIYDRLVTDGIDPTALSNETIFERAVAWHFLEALAATGYLNVGGQDSTQTIENMREMAERSYERVRPSLTSGDEPTRPGDSIPFVVNFETDFAYASRSSSSTPFDRLSEGIVDTL